VKEPQSILTHPIAALAGLCSLIALGGCASSSRSADFSPAAAFATRSAALFTSPDVEPPWGDEFEFTRRDAALAYSTPQPVLASSEWPDPGTPSLDNPRSVYFYSNYDYNRFIYFAPSRAGWR